MKEKRKRKKKCGKNTFRLELAKWRHKHGSFIFSNAHSIEKLMLCNWNLAKLAYLTFLNLNCISWALNLKSILKNKQNFPSK